MSSGRRDFLGKAAAVTAALGARALPLAAQRAATMPTPRASALTALFGLKYPIFSAAMGTTGVPELAIAVSNAGGLGAVGTGLNPTADLVRQRVSQAKSACASGVLIGTRFVATKEAGAHQDYKSAITRATAADTVLTVCFQDGWTMRRIGCCATGRSRCGKPRDALRQENALARATSSQQVPSPGSRNVVTAPPVRDPMTAARCWS